MPETADRPASPAHCLMIEPGRERRRPAATLMLLSVAGYSIVPLLFDHAGVGNDPFLLNAVIRAALVVTILGYLFTTAPGLLAAKDVRRLLRRRSKSEGSKPAPLSAARRRQPADHHRRHGGLAAAGLRQTSESNRDAMPSRRPPPWSLPQRLVTIQTGSGTHTPAPQTPRRLASRLPGRCQPAAAGVSGTCSTEASIAERR